MPETEKAVLLMAFGGVESLEQVEPFLRNILKGRPPSQKMVEEVKERYRLIGGKSPLREITLCQARALQESLGKRTKGTYPVYTGMRYWHPYIKDTLNEIYKAGISKVIAIVMAPQKSDYTAGAYQGDLNSALEGLTPKPEIKFISEWYNSRNFLEGIAEKIVEGLSFFPNREKTAVIFSAHSLPLKFVGPKDPYRRQMEETIMGIMDITGPLNWKLGYQSKGMIPGDWLGPDVDSIMEGLSEEGFENILLVPAGFVADHVETLYDIDIVYRKKAESLGLRFNRTPSLNDSPKLIDALTDIVLNCNSNLVK
jgi:ferrochelatase